MNDTQDKLHSTCSCGGNVSEYLLSGEIAWVCESCGKVKRFNKKEDAILSTGDLHTSSEFESDEIKEWGNEHNSDPEDGVRFDIKSKRVVSIEEQLGVAALITIPIAAITGVTFWQGVGVYLGILFVIYTFTGERAA